MYECLSYDDVLLKPQYSDIRTRKEVSLRSRLGLNLWFDLPIIASPMDTISELDMMLAMGNVGGLAVLHRSMTVNEQAIAIKFIRDLNKTRPLAAAIGVNLEQLDSADILVSAGANILCLDVAHGDHIMVKEALTELRKRFGKDVHLMAGTVATNEGYKRLCNWGADSVRVGVGSGSICTTRINTGHGLPVLQSIINCNAAHADVPIIADGGIRTPGDMVKAFAAGADFVMVGSYVAGTTETPGKIVNGKKLYRGQASFAGQVSMKGKAYSIEGVEHHVPYQGSVVELMKRTAENLRSGFSYSNARTIEELRENAEFIKISSGGLKESTAHIFDK